MEIMPVQQFLFVAKTDELLTKAIADIDRRLSALETIPAENPSTLELLSCVNAELEKARKRIKELETPAVEDLPYPALLENERRRFAAVMAENVRLKAENEHLEKCRLISLPLLEELARRQGESVKEFQFAADVLKDAELGRLVRAMPRDMKIVNRTYMRMGLPVHKWQAFMKSDGSDEIAEGYSNSPEDALRAAGVSVEEKPRAGGMWECANCHRLNIQGILACVECQTGRIPQQENIHGRASDDGLKKPPVRQEAEK